MAAKQKATFSDIHTALRTILKKYEGKGVAAQPDRPGNYVLIGPPTEASRGKDVWFAGVKTGKSYVSLHLMPVYAFPELLATVSPVLRKRMQGKSCFNFTRPDPILFKEVGKLVDASYKRFRAEKLIR